MDSDHRLRGDGPTHHAGSPRTRVRSVDARPPQPPRTTQWVRLLVATPLMTGFTLSGRLAVAAERNEAESGSLALGSRRRHAAGRRPARPGASLARTGPFRPLGYPSRAGPWLHGERAIHMADTSQSARVDQVDLAYQRTPRKAARPFRQGRPAGRRQTVTRSTDANN